MEISDLAEKIGPLLDYNKVYTNSTPIVHVAGVPILMHEIALAGLMARLNMVFIGRSGPGKSQLISDIKNGIFNGEAVHLRGSNDLKVRPIYASVNYDLLKEGRTDEAISPRHTAGRMLHIMEEFNRTLPMIQNEWLAVADGVLDIDGRQIPIQGNGYSIAIGAANIGHGEFSGTFQTDNALKERLVLALDFDGINKPHEADFFDIFESSSDPRVLQSEKSDRTGQIIEINRGLQELSGTLNYFVRMMQVYLAKGLDELVIGDKTYSKEEIRNLGSFVSKDHKAADDPLNFMMPPSVRAIKVFGALVPSLAAIAASKGAESEDLVFDACYPALELILPFSDSLPERAIAKNNGSRRLAALEIVESIRNDLSVPGENGTSADISDALGVAIQNADQGKLEEQHLAGFSRPRVRCFSRMLRKYNETRLAKVK